MRTARGFDDAKTVFIVNGGMDADYNVGNEYGPFIGSFKTLANYIGKNVIFNLIGHIFSTSVIRDTDYLELGFYDHEAKHLYSNDFRGMLFILFHPDR